MVDGKPGYRVAQGSDRVAVRTGLLTPRGPSNRESESSSPICGWAIGTLRVPIGTLISQLEPRVPAAAGSGRAKPLTLASSGERGAALPTGPIR